MKFFRKLPFAVLAAALLCAVGVAAWVPDTAAAAPDNMQIHIDLADVYKHPEKHPNTRLIIHKDVDDYIAALTQDENLSTETRDALIRDAMAAPASPATAYLTIRQTLTVTEEYSAYPYFYILSEHSGSDGPTAIIEVKSANLDTKHGDITKQFSGDLYYNLESAARLYWDLNGDFYNSGLTTVSDDVSLGGFLGLRFSVSSTSNHYAYLQEDGTFNL